jgi:hypothetical protein
MIARCFAVLVAVAAVLLALPAAAVPILVPVPPYVPSGATMPCSHYPWTLSRTATVAVPYGQPPASIPIAVLLPLPRATAYAWAQPGTAAAPLVHAQPLAWVAPASSCST